ncbi:putative quinol monooxygenase [Kineosporia succinea]|uniref:Heme-degrading monooxygenase HmoA n=1 Tax=Kineosporia succinea TaxID=84632 RepID=A0ABT9P9M5_9ACTN|nr:antibiotic biosynthesis monooxygenase family protein [Kineosporia succinea]MDP9829172.1 heme-degrading monooxygenase HmoA [Kineosporia succinea]
MLIQQVQIDVHPGSGPAFEAGLLDVRQKSFMAAGFRRFDVAQATHDPAVYQVQVRWETADELEAFTASGGFERAWDPVRAHLAQPLLVTVFSERTALDLQGPGVLTP